MAQILRYVLHPLIAQLTACEGVVLVVETTCVRDGMRVAMRTRYEIWEPWRREAICTN